MNPTAEQLQTASEIDALVERLVRDGSDDIAISLEGLIPYQTFGRPIDTSKPEVLDDQKELAPRPGLEPGTLRLTVA